MQVHFWSPISSFPPLVYHKTVCTSSALALPRYSTGITYYQPPRVIKLLVPLKNPVQTFLLSRPSFCYLSSSLPNFVHHGKKFRMRSTVMSMIKIAHEKYVLRVEGALARGNFKPFCFLTRHSHNATQYFLSSISLVDSVANSSRTTLLFFRIYSLKDAVSSMPLLDPGGSESLATPLFTPSSTQFFIGNLVPMVFQTSSLLTVNNSFPFLCVLSSIKV